MEYFKDSLIAFLLTLLFYSNTVISIENSNPEKSRQELIQLLQKWAENFNSKNLQETCELFAPDLVACFLGVPDENYEQNCKSLASVLNDKEKTYFYEDPLIEQVIVDRNIGIVRLVWKLKVTDKINSKAEVITARSLDVFTRQQDGNWKLSISFAYPEKTR